jgi:hypothetical protein
MDMNVGHISPLCLRHHNLIIVESDQVSIRPQTLCLRHHNLIIVESDQVSICPQTSKG